MKDTIRCYSGKLKDAFGNDVRIGDVVIVIAEECYAHNLRKTRVVGFGEHAKKQYFKVMATNYENGELIYAEAMNKYISPSKVALYEQCEYSKGIERFKKELNTLKEVK